MKKFGLILIALALLPLTSQASWSLADAKCGDQVQQLALVLFLINHPDIPGAEVEVDIVGSETGKGKASYELWEARFRESEGGPVFRRYRLKVLAQGCMISSFSQQSLP